MQNMQATTNSIIGRIIDLISVTSRAVRYASFRLLRSSSSSNNVLLTISEFVLDSKVLLEYKNLVRVFFSFFIWRCFFPLTYRKIKSSKKWKKRIRAESSINWFRNKLISQIFKAFWLGKFEEFFWNFFVKHQFLNWEEWSSKSPLQNSMDFLESETQKCNLSTK